MFLRFVSQSHNLCRLQHKHRHGIQQVVVALALVDSFRRGLEVATIIAVKRRKKLQNLLPKRLQSMLMEIPLRPCRLLRKEKKN